MIRPKLGPDAIINNQQLLLIDGYAQIYRAFYAIRGLTDASGQPTNALYGVARFLMVLDDAFPHQYGGFVLDKGQPQERLELLPSYKANRPPMPEDLRSQVSLIREWVTAWGYPVFEKEGCEADDLIAGLVQADLGIATLIVSPDKDLGQLVSDQAVRMVIPGKKGVFTVLQEADVMEKFGVRPNQIRDWLALVGDTADNIPGVPGVGAKTAAKLLRQFGSIETMVAQCGKISRPKLRELICNHADHLEDNKKLVALMPELPDQWENLETARKKNPDWKRLLELTEHYGFHSLKKQLLERQKAFENPSLFDFNFT